jgi:hypothetical protein
MKDFATIPRISGTFPNVEVVPDTAPHSHDGTPLHYQWGNEVFGAFQAILNGASLTPSVTTSETCGATAGDVTGSQIVEALQLMLGYPGEIVMYALATPTEALPTGIRLEKCDGDLVQFISGVTPTKYYRLMQAKYIGDAHNADTNYKCFFKCNAGGSRTTSGEYFALPDYRGAFMRGWDPSATHDPDGATRKCGDIQVDGIESHNHEWLYNGAGTDFGFGDVANGSGESGLSTPGAPLTNYLRTGNEGISETRPTNAMICYCIRY